MFLVVDDSQSFRDLLRLELGPERTHTAGSIVEGLTLVKANLYDVIFLDHWFDYGPHQGIDAIKYYRAASPDSDIVMLTADVDLCDKARAFDAGADAYVEKGDMKRIWKALLRLVDIDPLQITPQSASSEHHFRRRRARAQLH